MIQVLDQQSKYWKIPDFHREKRRNGEDNITINGGKLFNNGQIEIKKKLL